MFSINTTMKDFAVPAGLAHCRHLKTVRTHLSGLVYHTIVAIDDPMFAGDGLTPEKWAEICVNGVVGNLIS